MKSIRKLHQENPVWLTIYWCDRCQCAINQNEEPNHTHPECCENCARYCRLDGAWGCCTNSNSLYGGRVIYQGDTCVAWQSGPANPEFVGKPRPLSRYRAQADPPLKPEQGAEANINDLHAMRPVLCQTWCDRCGRVPDGEKDPDHFHPEQCGGCRKYRELDKDWGYCASHQSVYGGRKVNEHDTCRQWVEGTWR